MYAYEHLEQLHRTLANFEFKLGIRIGGRLVTQEKERNLYASITKAKEALDIAYENAKPFSIPLAGAGYAVNTCTKPIEFIAKEIQSELGSEVFIGSKMSDDHTLYYFFFTNINALPQAKTCLLRIGVSESEMREFIVEEQ
jgi:hypothetical protein